MQKYHFYLQWKRKGFSVWTMQILIGTHSKISLNQTEIIRKMVNPIWLRLHSIRFRKGFTACIDKEKFILSEKRSRFFFNMENFEIMSTNLFGKHFVIINLVFIFVSLKNYMHADLVFFQHVKTESYIHCQTHCLPVIGQRDKLFNEWLFIFTCVYIVEGWVLNDFRSIPNWVFIPCRGNPSQTIATRFNPTRLFANIVHF